MAETSGSQFKLIEVKGLVYKIVLPPHKTESQIKDVIKVQNILQLTVRGRNLSHVGLIPGSAS